MATRSTICVEIPTDKIGKSYKYNKGKNKFDTPEVVIPEGMKYVEVYHHWDGYPTGLGADLIEEKNGYDNFDSIMEEIISGGDMSCIGTPYHAWRDEDWDDVQPKFTEELPSVREEYQYLFTLDGEWKVRDDYDMEEFISVDEAIKKEE